MGIDIIAQNANKLQIISINSVIKTISLSSYSSAVPFKITEYDGDFYIVYQKGPVIEINSNGNVINVFKLPNIGKFPEICSADDYVIVTASDGNVVYFIKNGVMHNVTVMQSPQVWLTIITLKFYMWAVSFFVLIEIFLSVYRVWTTISFI